MMPSRFKCAELRIGRVSEPGRIYMITSVTHSRQPVFSIFPYGRCVVQALQEADRSAETLAFCIMPDHLHWLMQLRAGYQLKDVVHFVKATSTRRIRQLTKDKRRIWSKGYHDHALRKEEDIVDCARYIVANPLRAGLVTRVGDYPLWDAAWL